MHGETGDYDGDGRLSIRDVIWFLQQPDLPPEDRDLSPGSLDGFLKHPCWEDWQNKKDLQGGTNRVNGFLSGPVYLESLRRAVPDPLPHWEPLWDESLEVVRAPPDPRVEILWGESPATYDNGWATLSLRLRTDVAIQAFSIIVESEDQVLRVPLFDDPTLSDDFDVADWLMVHSVRDQGELHSFGDVPVPVDFASFLITNGRFVIGYGLDYHSPFQEILSPGEHSIVVKARIPRGTSAGAYTLNVLSTAEVLTVDGELLTPVAPDAVDLPIDRDVTIDWSDGVPPLEFDLENRRILGPVAFRVTEAEGLPGEEVPLKIQMRTETPLNQIYIRARWDHTVLECAGDRANVLYDNGAGEPVTSRVFGGWCVNGMGGFLGNVELELLLAGAVDRNPAPNPERVLEYFKPLGEWIDLLELPIRIKEGAASGERIPIELSLTKEAFVPAVARGWPTVQYWPYTARWNCSASFPEGDYRLNWTYEIHLKDGSIGVLGESPGKPVPPPPDAGVRWILEDTSGEPGDLVRVPVLLSAQLEPLPEFILSLEVEPPVTEIEAVVLNARNRETGEVREVVAHRGETGAVRDCIEDPPGFVRGCEFGDIRVRNRDFATLDEHRAYLEIIPDVDLGDFPPGWPGRELRRIGHILVRIPEDYTGDTIYLRHSAVPESQSPWDLEIGSGARVYTQNLPPGTFTGSFSPAAETRDAVIYVGAGTPFIRGDVNGDGTVNLADPVFLLQHLFGGGEQPSCTKAADTNDDGGVDVADAVSVLNSLFAGGGALPEPHGVCGFDRTQDDLSCEAAPACRQ